MKDLPDGYWNALNAGSWTPSVLAELAPNFERLQSTLQIVNRAQDDRREGRPLVTDTELNQAQEDIRQQVVEGVLRLDDELTGQVTEASTHMIEDSEEIYSAARVQDLVASLTMIIRPDEPLKQLAMDYVAANDERNRFVQRNQLNPPPLYQEHLSTFAIALMGTMFFETVTNALVLRSVNIDGLVGGLGVSVLISAANGGLGLAGGVGWRLLSHVRPIVKVLGSLVTAIASAGAVLCNLIAAHYRQVADDALAQQAQVRSSVDSALIPGESPATTDFFSSAMPRAEQLDAAIHHLREFGVFGFQSIWSWVLFMVGLGIFFTVCYKSWDDYGRYWGYRSRDLRRKRAKESLDWHIRQVEDSAYGYIEEQNKACDTALTQLERKASDAYREAKQVERLHRGILALLDQWVQVGNRLLKLYRETNAQGCSPDSLPEYWNTYWTTEEYKHLLASDSSLSGAADEYVESTMQGIRSRRKALDRILRNSRREREIFARVIVDLAKAVPGRMNNLRSQVVEWANGEVARLFPRTS